ncbi:Cof-like hydrolase [Thiorhodococcus drewsii AZ1]|uniref:Cof-like hydrolase n=1 Tax=Thiorhodococcus drewsii AZ1 TaxID=765913 RepID=G2DX73_9GAMM|nr:Cof-type HAD-IIB family hydrolase [Thiorhodococcus drewsii]EGV33427.1 Cof-like hydrolase [Thiorhodococcus drewsii AZ1]
MSDLSALGGAQSTVRFHSCPYRLVVCDLDGTLLNDDHRLGEHSRAVLNTLQDRGVQVLLASGRHYLDLQRIAEQLGSQGALISSNGALAHDSQGQMTHCHPIVPDCLDFLLRDPVFGRAHVNLYRVDGWLVETPKPLLLRYHQDSGFAYRMTDFATLDESPVLKVFYYAEDPDYLQDLEHRILDRHGDQLDTTYALPVVLEVMAKGVSKGEALADMVQRLGLNAAEVIAFGDGRNDLEMLRYAGKGVLMANADPRLKEALPDLEVIGSNAEESVATYLRTLFGLQV